MKTPPTPMFLIAAANAFVGLDLSAAPASTGMHGIGEGFLREVHARVDGAHRPTWDAAFAHHVGYWSHFDNGVGASSWPLPPVATAAALADFADRHRMLFTRPEQGDLFLIWSESREGFVRTGVVVGVEPFGVESYGTGVRGVGDVDCVVIEGDTNAERSFSGGYVLRHQRTFSAARGDRFIRWTAGERIFRAPGSPALLRPVGAEP